MDPRKSFRDILKKTAVLKVPKHRISTFGFTKIRYFFVSQVPAFPDRTRLREGFVVAESPKLITPDVFKNRFEGFGSESEEFGQWLSDHYGESFRGLQYRFKNDLTSGKVEFLPVKALCDNIAKNLSKEGWEQSALIRGPDAGWQVGLMKFIADECMRSFADNLRELDEHGYFEAPQDAENHKRKEIEGLFSKARANPDVLSVLGSRLKQSGLFPEYEDRFFKLVQR
ncbi:MAG: hypothetical protein A2901_03435 [Elusimicrobia bacterium RIFCSPLOWO2_01_FULL_54_10]|nr:MAG: hypothetical protein A2901_03435 [Elusimicrobia bacterium RIFCSPLOWO2_01_FULL_54_10]